MAPYAGPTRYDFGADLGGFLMKDRIWFFGGVQPREPLQDYESHARSQMRTGGVDRHASHVTNGRRRNNLFSGKLTFRLGESHTVAASGFGDPGSFHGDLSRSVGDPRRSSARTTSAVPTSRQVGRHLRDDVPRAGPDVAPEESDDNSPLGSEPVSLGDPESGSRSRRTRGGPTSFLDEKYQRYVYKVASTMFLGTHEIKAGVDYEDINSAASPSAYSGRGRISHAD